MVWGPPIIVPTWQRSSHAYLKSLRGVCLAQIAGALLVVAGVVTAAWPSQGASVFTEVSAPMPFTGAAPALVARPSRQGRSILYQIGCGAQTLSSLHGCSERASQVSCR